MIVIVITVIIITTVIIMTIMIIIMMIVIIIMIIIIIITATVAVAAVRGPFLDKCNHGQLSLVRACARATYRPVNTWGSKHPDAPC